MGQYKNTELSTYIKELTYSHKELALLSQRLDRLEQAVLHIAQETGVKLKFDF